MNAQRTSHVISLMRAALAHTRQISVDTPPGLVLAHVKAAEKAMKEALEVSRSERDADALGGFCLGACQPRSAGAETCSSPSVAIALAN